MGSKSSKNQNNNEEQQNNSSNEKGLELIDLSDLSTIKFLQQKGYNFGQYIQRNTLRDIILVYQFLNHQYHENIIISIKSTKQSIKQLKCYLESFQKEEPYTYSTHIVEHFSNQNETVYFIVKDAKTIGILTHNFHDCYRLKGLDFFKVLTLSIQLLKIIENLINNNIYNYPLDIYSIGYNNKREQIVLIDELFLFNFSDKQNKVNPELQYSIDATNSEREKKQKATKDYLNRVGVILTEILFGIQVNKYEQIKESKIKIQDDGFLFLQKQLKHIFWKKIVYNKNKEINLSNLITKIQSLLAQNKYLSIKCIEQIRDIFYLSKELSYLSIHGIYLLYQSQIKDTQNIDIPSQKISKFNPRLDDNNQFIQSNKDFNNINGTIIDFNFNFSYQKEDNNKINQEKIIIIEFLKKCSKIQRLYLNLSFLNKFTSEECINIFKSIRHCTSLVSLELDIGYIEITTEAINELMLSLQQFMSLRKLKLRLSNCFQSEHVQQIIEQLKNNKLLSDVKLDLNCQISFSQEYNIFSSFQYIPITYLDLNIRYNNLQNRLSNIGEDLKKCQLLKILNLQYIAFDHHDDDDDNLIIFGNQIKQYPSLLKLELNLWWNKNTETVKLEFCKNLTRHTLINTIKIDFSTIVDYQINPKSQMIENAFKKKKNFMNICVKL